MKELYSVNKHQHPVKGLAWFVQMPKGIYTFTTKRAATAFANSLKEASK
jgi:hypothetical protein